MKKIKAILKAKCVDHCYFVDKVSGKPVRLYERPDGTHFMAESKLLALFFRVECMK